MRRNHRYLTLWVIALLCACGGDTGPVFPRDPSVALGSSGLDQVPEQGPFDPLAQHGGRAQWLMEPGCHACDGGDPAAANDLDIDSAATLTFGVSATRTAGAVLRATAPPGVVFPAGDVPGVTIVRSTWINMTVELRTLRDGVVQDRLVQALSTAPNPALSVDEFRVTATRPFDAVEFRLAPGPTAQAVVVAIQELYRNDGY